MFKKKKKTNSKRILNWSDWTSNKDLWSYFNCRF